MTKLAFLIILAVSLSTCADEIVLSYQVGKASYRVGDTVVVGIKVTIPKGYNLYANPLGPGIGKPLNLYVNSIVSQNNKDDNSIRWFEARRSTPKRYTPPIGDWVWAYDKSAYFFVKGVVEGERPGKDNAVKYEVTIDALICKASCVPMIRRLSFELPIQPKYADPSECACPFQAEPDWLSRYAKSEPTEFKAGEPERLASFNIDHEGDDAADALGIDLSGLSSLGGIKLPDDASIDGVDDDNTDVVREVNTITWDYSPVEERRDYNFLTGILFALLAGLAMNLTPCIFPMLSIRVLSFAESARESRRRAVARSAMFSLGIVAVFIILAAFAAFAGLSWGHQFQNPTVMVGIISVIFLFALGMFDFYTLSAPSAVGNMGRKAGSAFLGDFLKGAIATVMATPCAGPFLGALLAWALLQPPPMIFMIFTLMGVGMSIPYILLSSSGKLIKLLPKPGAWIEDFKHIMGFILFGFAINMMRGLDQGMILPTVGIALSILAAACINKRYAPFGAELPRRVTVGVISLALLAAGVIVSFTYLRGTPSAPLGHYGCSANCNAVPSLFPMMIEQERGALWQNFSARALLSAHENERSVIVNFTAAWCTNCKLNKSTVLDSETARQLYKEKNILLLTADITNINPEAESLLSHLGSRSIPFLAIFPSNSPKTPIIMRDIISKDKYAAALNKLP